MPEEGVPPPPLSRLRVHAVGDGVLRGPDGLIALSEGLGRLGQEQVGEMSTEDALSELEGAIDSRRAWLALVIPSDFGSGLAAGRQAHVRFDPRQYLAQNRLELGFSAAAAHYLDEGRRRGLQRGPCRGDPADLVGGPGAPTE